MIFEAGNENIQKLIGRCEITVGLEAPQNHLRLPTAVELAT